MIGKLIMVGLIPVALSALLYQAIKRTPFGRLKYMTQQIIIGVLFGIVAVFGTEYGVDIGGAQANARDAAPLCAGLIFGAPAGIIAGMIGGIERWFAVYWGVGSFTRIACSVSTIIAGLYGALVRKYMFKNKMPSPLLAFAVGIVAETFHMMMVFLTNLNASEQAFAVVRICTIPMITVNSVAVLLAVIVISLFSEERKLFVLEHSKITQKMQLRLFAAILVCFILTTVFTFTLQSGISRAQTNRILSMNLKDVQQDISDDIDYNLLKISRKVARELNPYMDRETLQAFADEYDISEINLISHYGIIVQSTNPLYTGYNMNSGEQSAAFMVLAEKNGKIRELVQPYQKISFDNSTGCKYAGVRMAAGFAQFGYNEERFQKDVADTVDDITANRHIGQNGYILITDYNGKIVSDPELEHLGKKFEKLCGIKVSDLIAQIKPFKTFRFNDGTMDAYAMYAEHEGYYIIAIQDLAEANHSRDLAIYINAFTQVLLFAVLYTIIFFIISKLVVENVEKVNDSLSQIAAGNLDVKVDVHDTSEFASLSKDINITVDRLKEYIAEAEARIDAELGFAKNIQASSLPNVFPPFPSRTEVDLHATMDTAKEVGGDFYDYYWLDDERLAVLIADVSGKGIPAAMFMMRAKTMIKNFMQTGLEVNAAMTRANSGLCEGNDAEMFVTAWLGVINVKTGHVEFANAGHNPPVVKHANGEFEYLVSRAGFVLAGMDGVRYKKQEMDLEPGSILYLYTDGVTEATSLDNELYGEDRLISCLNEHSQCSMKDLCIAVKADVDRFVGEADQFDDITMVAFKLIPEEERVKELKINATLDNIPAVTEWVDGQLEELGCSMKAQMQIDVAIDELFSNIARYAYNPEVGPATVRVQVEKDPMSVIITFLDHGVPYDPLEKEDPDITLSAEERSIGGLGIFMVKKTMDDIRYEYKDGQNILTIKKNI